MSDWSPGLTLAEVEKQTILKAFRFFQGNKTRTAAALGIAPRTLDYKLEQYGVSRDDCKPSVEVPKKPEVPVRQSEEIQEVLPVKAAKINSNSGRNK